MEKQDLEQKIRTAVDHAAPDVLDQILAQCEAQTGTVVPLPPSKKRKGRWIAAAAGTIAAAFLLTFGLIYGYGAYTENQIDSVVALDVNPSVELRINAAEKVLETRALNQEAEEVLDGMDLKGTHLDVAVNEVLGAMLENGYIAEEANSILISVENANTQKSAVLKQKLAKEVDQVLQSKSIEGAILSQTLPEEKEEVRQLAEQNNISVGKAVLIQDIVKQNERLQFEDLAKASINDLNLLADSQNAELSNVLVTGTASEKKYIGRDKAKEIAFSHTGVAEKNATNLKVELDREDGKMVYDVEFTSANQEYEIDVDAVDGTVLKAKQEPQKSQENPGATTPGGDTTSSTTEPSYIGKAKAQQLAVAHAGLSDGRVTNGKSQLEPNEGNPFYQVEFWNGTVKYQYQVDAQTGAILKFTSENQKTDASSSQNTGSSDSPSTQNYIGEGKAQELAFAHAGVSADLATLEKNQLEQDDGRIFYELEFQSGNTEYTYKIHAVTGKILEFHSETDNPPVVSQPSESSKPAESQETIGRAKAKEIAFSHAGLSADQVSKVSIELAKEEGRSVYEIEFQSSMLEYHYEIDASTGTILQFDSEIEEEAGGKLS